MLADARLPMRTMLALAAMMGALFLIFVRAAHDKATAPRTRLAYSPRAPPAPANASRPAWCGRPEACDRWQPALGQSARHGSGDVALWYELSHSPQDHAE